MVPRSVLVWFAGVLLSVASTIGLASAGPGDLDPTFGGDGRVVLNGSFSRVAGLAIQADGRIVVGGGIGNDFGLVRLLPDGSLDSDFGTNGIVTTNFGGSEEIRAIAIQPDGQIVAVGSSISAAGLFFAVARYSTDGSLDSSFGSDGKVLTGLPGGPHGRGGEATAVALQVGDALKIVVAGTAFTGGIGTDEDVAVVRYNADGSLDTGFNGTGKVVVANFPRREFPAAIAILPDGKIVVGGTARDPLVGDFDVLLVRFDAVGGLDVAFGVPGGVGYPNGGQVTTDFSDLFGPLAVADDVLGGIAVQADGKIVAGGYTEDWDTGAKTFGLARYGAGGALDPTFGVEGRVNTPAGAGAALVLRPDGKILLGGFAVGIQGRDFALVQYDAGGGLDSTFGTGGLVTTDFGGGGSDAIQALALQADQKIVAAGTRVGAFATDLAVARYLGGDTTAPTILSARVTPSLLWPANHQLVPVVVEVTATDDGGSVTCAISGIDSTEPVIGLGDGDTAPDWLYTGPLTASLRAERSGGGVGRIYTLTVQCQDGAANVAATQLLVTVPHSRR